MTYPLTKQKVLVVACAYNEEAMIPVLLDSMRGYDLLVVDDGSTDRTGWIALNSFARVITHKERLGKASSLQDAITYSKENQYDIVVEIGADAVPTRGSLETLIDAIAGRAEVGAVSARQIPIGPRSVTFCIDELLWSVLAHGKKIQQARYESCHLGAVFYAFKPQHVRSVIGVVNDDEELGNQIRTKGLRTIYEWNAVAYFDASRSIGHILERRTRMIVGHMEHGKSIAPCMNFKIVGPALIKTIAERPSRALWVIPSILLELWARLNAWRDVRNPKTLKGYAHWVTKHAKNNISGLWYSTKC